MRIKDLKQELERLESFGVTDDTSIVFEKGRHMDPYDQSFEATGEFKYSAHSDTVFIELG